MQRFSRREWEQVVGRVNKISGHFDQWICVICGKKFNHAACPHSVDENQEIIDKVREQS